MYLKIAITFCILQLANCAATRGVRNVRRDKLPITEDNWVSKYVGDPGSNYGAGRYSQQPSNNPDAPLVPLTLPNHPGMKDFYVVNPSGRVANPPPPPEQTYNRNLAPRFQQMKGYDPITGQIRNQLSTPMEKSPSQHPVDDLQTNTALMQSMSADRRLPSSVVNQLFQLKPENPQKPTIQYRTPFKRQNVDSSPPQVAPIQSYVVPQTQPQPTPTMMQYPEPVAMPPQPAPAVYYVPETVQPQAAANLMPQTVYMPPQPPQAVYMPPEQPQAEYMPPQPPQAVYMPPQPPQAVYMPPEQTQAVYMPPQPPQAVYMPPQPPQAVYMPPPAYPMQTGNDWEAPQNLQYQVVNVAQANPGLTSGPLYLYRGTQGGLPQPTDPYQPFSTQRIQVRGVFPFGSRKY